MTVLFMNPGSGESEKLENCKLFFGENPTAKGDNLESSRQHERNHCVGISAALIGSAKLSWMS